MELSHNSAFHVMEGSYAGIYRVVLEEIQLGKILSVRLDSEDEATRKAKGGRKRLLQTKRPRKKPRAPMCGTIIWLDRDELLALEKNGVIANITIEQENYPLSDDDQMKFEFRKKVMAPFLSEFDHFREMILLHRGIAGLVKEAVALEASESLVRNCFSLLCRYGFEESSLRPTRSLRCGAPGVSRPCDPGTGRQKPGRKTNKQRLNRAGDFFPVAAQPGMNSLWRAAILAADNRIPTPKPSMPERIQLITESTFVRTYRDENGKLIPVPPEFGTYPNPSQIERVLRKHKTRLQQILEKTTKGHIDRCLRGLVGRSWKGVAGPGHTWAIDSTVGDVYLRSSVNRYWIIGRPIVYVVVDVWSTAIVGFYVCLEGPSWAMAKLALFCSIVDAEWMGDVLGYPVTQSLYPAPQMCSVLLCDRGEYLSLAAKACGAKLALNLSYTPPYRPDLKGVVEVLHRIAKDQQFYFLPGAIDQRRKELELRRFNPNDAVMTLREYAAFLREVFTTYNLTASREHRLDAHMHGAGVYPSPAGLWRYGHEVGIGVRRNISTAKLFTELLPSQRATVTRDGVKFLGMEYRAPEIEALEWTARARNLGAWDINTYYFPPTVSRIWSPDASASGLLELNLSDHSTASPELTVEEVQDAFMVGKLDSQERAHIKLMTALDSQRRRKEIIEQATELTAEAVAKSDGQIPSISEARAIERAKDAFVEEASNEVSVAEGPRDVEASYQQLMGDVFAAMNA